MLKRVVRNVVAPISSILAMSFCFPAHSTIVEIQTSQGSIQVNLFDEATPKTVENFLAYVNDGAYVGAMFHRSLPGFVLQGGGFTFDGESTEAIPSNPAVINEPVYSNLRGTIAMAKTGGNENSATNQWFFNLADNSANLDLQNGGFTAFGQVVEADMATVDKIVAIQTCNAGAPFDNLPLVDFDCAGNNSIATENLVIINQVVIVDSSETTAADLTPTENTLIKAEPEPDAPTDTNKDSGGGSVYWILGLLTALFSIRKMRN